VSQCRVEVMLQTLFVFLKSSGHRPVSSTLLVTAVVVVVVGYTVWVHYHVNGLTLTIVV